MWAHIWAPKQPPPTFNCGLTYNFFFIYRTLSMRQKTINLRNQGSIDKKIDFFSQTLSHIPRWVRLEQKTRAKNSHAWAPLTCHSTFLFGRKPFLILRPMPFLYTTILYVWGNFPQLFFTTAIRTGEGDVVLEIEIWRITEEYGIAKWLYKGLTANCRSLWCC